MQNNNKIINEGVRHKLFLCYSFVKIMDYDNFFIKKPRMIFFISWLFVN